LRRSYFPDINLWLSLNAADHVHTKPALEWYYSIEDEDVLYFCRLTQLGLLRLLTTKSVMGVDTHSQRNAWMVYCKWRDEAGAGFMNEPARIDTLFRARSETTQASPKFWNDAYLAAFAEAAELTLVTFDHALAEKTKDAILLG
jgi:toxin-antitoxin system PIN domain toxin